MAESGIGLAKYMRSLESVSPVRFIGKVTKVVGLVIEGYAPDVSLGGICHIYSKEWREPLAAEVVGFREKRVLLMPLGDLQGIAPGCPLTLAEPQATIQVSDALLGRVIGGLGEPLDDKGVVPSGQPWPLYAEPINPLVRQRIRVPLDVGIRAINGLLTVGKGQRVCVLSGTGVGKSVLLGMMARGTKADVNVIALIGERGREVREFIDRDLGAEGLARSVVVAATSDCPPLVRMRGAFAAMAIAEYFRAQGKEVLLLMDSITRFATALRQVGLAIGEPPATKGYTPSVFAAFPKLLERAGTSADAGTITGLFAVLVEGDDLTEPIADAVRAIVDGHIVLSRSLAIQNHYPAIDVLDSKSRVMRDVVPAEHVAAVGKFISTMAVYEDAVDLINVGAYVKGSNPRIDDAVAKIEGCRAYLRQGIEERVGLAESVEGLRALFP